MSKFAFITITAIFLAGCSGSNDMDDLNNINGLYYKIGDDNPFTGKIANDYAGGHIYGTGYNGIVFAKGLIAEGKKEGNWTEWYSNDQMFYQGNFFNGKEEGLHTWWHPNGLVLGAGRYKNGLRNGLYKRWHESGSLNLLLYYEEDTLHGEQYKYDESGNLYIYAIYQHDKLICQINYESNGDILNQKGRCKTAVEEFKYAKEV